MWVYWDSNKSTFVSRTAVKHEISIQKLVPPQPRQEKICPEPMRKAADPHAWDHPRLKERLFS